MKMRMMAILAATAILCGCASTAQRAARARLDSIVIPEIEFRQANAHDVAHFLADAGRPDPQQADPRERGIGIILNLGTDREWEDPLGFDTPQSNVPLITFTAHNISLRAALDAVCDAAALRYEIDRNGVIHFHRRGPTKPCTVRAGVARP
jgi:hypothetical protein